MSATNIEVLPVAVAPGARRTPGRRQDRQPKHLQSNLTGYLMIAPMVVLLAIFVIWPLCYAIYLSGFRISFYQPPKWVGLQFYQYVLTDPRFWHSLRVGLLYAVLTVPTGMVVALLLASFIATLSRSVASFMKTTVYVPAVVSSVVAAEIFVFIYQDQGLANWFITRFNTLRLFEIRPVAWLNNTTTALPAVAVPGVWLGFGITTLILLAALLDIPDSYYESASLDGAGFVQKMWYITIPSLKNVLLYLFVVGFTLSVQEFLLPLIMTNGGPVDATNTMNLYIFNSFRDFTPYATSFSLAAALLLFVLLGGISMVIFRLVSSDKAMDG